jgi:uncharacterized membrane protein
MENAAQTGPSATPAFPTIRIISLADIQAALSEGIADFRAAPQFGLVLGGIYALAGWLVVGSVAFMGASYLAYPLAAGFVLLGPFVAVGLYEVSRSLENGRKPTWGEVLRVVFAQSGREFAWLAFVAIFAFIIWMYQVRLLLALFLGFQSFASLPAFLDVVFTSADGLAFLAVGHVVGAIMATLVFSLTVISFPLLLDRDLDFITAMIASVKAVIDNPVPMLLWALAIVVIVMMASAPAFLGLPIALPILGHATWRLYRRVVAPV